jgi:hypothetical protein
MLRCTARPVEGSSIVVQIEMNEGQLR